MATIEQLKPLQSFPSVSAMDERISEFVTLNKHALSEARRKVLDYLRTHAVLVPGVCNASQKKIAAAIGVCKRTVMRAIDFFESCGLIKVEAQERESGATASNAFVFQPMSPAMSSAHVTPIRINSFTPSSTPDQEIVDNYVDVGASALDTIELIDLLPDEVPLVFGQVAYPVLNDLAEVTSFWRAAKNAIGRLKQTVRAKFVAKAFIEAESRRREKKWKGETIANFIGYFVRTVVKMIQEPKVEERKPAFAIAPEKKIPKTKYDDFYSAYGEKTAKEVIVLPAEYDIEITPGEREMYRKEFTGRRQQSGKPHPTNPQRNPYDFDPKNAKIYASNGADIIDDNARHNEERTIDIVAAAFKSAYGSK